MYAVEAIPSGALPSSMGKVMLFVRTLPLCETYIIAVTETAGRVVLGTEDEGTD